MGFQSIEEAEAYIEEHGERGARERVAQGVFGNDKRTLELISEAFARRERAKLDALQLEALNSSRRSANASEGAAHAAARSAYWTMVAAIATLLGVAANVLLAWPAAEKSAGEQLSLCKNFAERDLGPRAFDDSRRTNYVDNCMDGNGFEFQGEDGQKCHATSVAAQEVKQLLPGCYLRRPKSLLAHLRG